MVIDLGHPAALAFEGVDDDALGGPLVHRPVERRQLLELGMVPWNRKEAERIRNLDI